MHSTTARAKHMGGEPQRKCLQSRYARLHGTVLRRQVESALTAGTAVMDEP